MSLPGTEPPFQSSPPSVRLRFDSRHRSQRSRTATSEVEGVRCSILMPNAVRSTAKLGSGVRSLNDVIRPKQQQRWNRDPECFRGLE